MAQINHSIKAFLSLLPMDMGGLRLDKVAVTAGAACIHPHWGRPVRVVTCISLRKDFHDAGPVKAFLHSMKLKFLSICKLSNGNERGFSVRKEWLTGNDNKTRKSNYKRDSSI